MTFESCFVVRSVKVIEGSGGLLIAMPSRKPKAPCRRCHFRVDQGAKFCPHCGMSQGSGVELTRCGADAG